MRQAVVITCVTDTYIPRLMNDVLVNKRIVDHFDIYIIDNGKTYTLGCGEYMVLRPGEGLRWLRGMNVGIELAKSLREYDGFFLLNDDLRLSRGFFLGLVEASLANPAAGVIAPMYDDVWPNQKNSYQGIAADYIPNENDRDVPFVDFPAVYITRECWDNIGPLDTRFWFTGWGSDFDFCLRATENGYKVIATERAYCNHVKQGSKDLADWESVAGAEMNAGMFEKYGHGWQARLGI